MCFGTMKRLAGRDDRVRFIAWNLWSSRLSIQDDFDGDHLVYSNPPSTRPLGAGRGSSHGLAMHPSDGMFPGAHGSVFVPMMIQLLYARTVCSRVPAPACLTLTSRRVPLATTRNPGPLPQTTHLARNGKGAGRRKLVWQLCTGQSACTTRATTTRPFMLVRRESARRPGLVTRCCCWWSCWP